MRAGTSRWAAIAAAGAVLTMAGVAVATQEAAYDPQGQEQVGPAPGGATVLPDNQTITPLGNQIQINNERIIASALSPDGTKLAALSSSQLLPRGLTIFDLRAGKVLQQVGPIGGSTAGALGDGTVAADPPLYSPDGRTLWVSQATDILRMAVNADGTVNTTPVATIKISATHKDRGPFGSGSPVFAPSGDSLPSGMALSPGGKQLYVALNGNNTLGVIDTSTNTLTRQIPVGNAPRQVVVSGRYAWVSNEAGHPAGRHNFTNYSDLTRVVASPTTGAATSGTVSVVNLHTNRQRREIPVGLGPAAMTLDHRYLFVVNTNGDSVSVIDTRRQRVARTVRVRPLPGASVGSNVNAILRPDRSHLLLSLGRDNAIAEYRYTGVGKPVRLLGLMPTGFYPVAVQRSKALRELVVTAGKGIGARGGQGAVPIPGVPVATAYITHLETGTVATFPVPGGAALSRDTAQVRANNAWNYFAAVNHGQGDTVPSVIPPRRGLPSVIKHVFLIIKENRTYDQVFGDLGTGNGDPALTQFGATVTPNMHALARRFGDLDNFYDEATLSADGHNWIVQADANDYIESSFGSFSRSYPASGGDALAYQRDGFLWDDALRHGQTVRNYGEYANFISVPQSGGPTWADWYKDSQILEGKASGPLPVPIDKYRNYTDVPSLNRVTNPYFPVFDLDIPDQYRVDVWERDFRAQVASGNFPNLTLMTIMSDHTAVPPSSGGSPNPVSEVADNDLGVGRIVSDISHSKFWPSTAIFVVEDDSQDGVDHVDGHRAPILIVSPYSKSGVDSNYYTQLNMTRTIEQILGLPPMTQGDANAVPMYGAFNSQSNLTPYSTQSNVVPLTLGSKSGLATSASEARWRYLVEVPRSERAVAAAWKAWGRRQHFGGHLPVPDFAVPLLLNHYDWYAAHGWRRPYPGERQIFTPAQLYAAGIVSPAGTAPTRQWYPALSG